MAIGYTNILSGLRLLLFNEKYFKVFIWLKSLFILIKNGDYRIQEYFEWFKVTN